METPESQIAEAKELIQGLSFQWYQERLHEISSFSSQCTSKTAKELIETAQRLTTLSYREWDELRNSAMSVMGNSISEYEKACALENQELREAHEKMMAAAMKDGDIKERTRELEYWGGVATRNIEKSAHNKHDVSNTALSMTRPFVDLSKSLLHETYKPNYRQFHKDSAKEILWHLLKKFDRLGLLDDFEAARKLDPKYRLRGLLQSADQIMIYLEQYNEQLVEWILTAKALKGELART